MQVSFFGYRRERYKSASSAWLRPSCPHSLNREIGKIGVEAMHVIHRNTCRICGSSALTRVIDLGEQYLQGSFVKAGKELPPMRKIPTCLVRCDPTRDEKA